MPPILRALLEHAIDYAGLFPPARLSFDDSLRNYLAYRQSPQAWMLGGFVCPAGQLDELATLLAAHDPASTVDLCLIASPAESLSRAAETLREDLRRTGEFVRAIASRTMRPQDPLGLSLEFRLPADGCRPSAPFAVLLDGIHQTATEFDVPLGPVFLETPLDEESLTAAAFGVSSFLRHTGGVFGLKFRTGGLDAAAYPSCEALARGMAVCRDHRLPYKLTAGLHQPLRHAEPALGAVAHGFLNVLVAAALADAHRGLPAAEIQAILAEETATNFAFAATHLRWGERTAPAEQIRAARRHGLVSFGSCSFDEPVEALRALGWQI